MKCRNDLDCNGKVRIALTNKNSIEYTDEMLSMIYKSVVFQSLDEERQRAFLDAFMENKTFYEMVSVLQSLQEVIEEVEKFIPPIPEDAETFFMAKNKSILDKITISENVIYLSKQQFQKQVGPLIVCLQQGDDMLEVEEFCKGMLLSLFDVCYRQRRDLYIIAFAEELRTIEFPLYELQETSFSKFVNGYEHGVTKIKPALQKAMDLFTSSEVKKQTEVMIVSNHHFVDYEEDAFHEFAQFFESNSITVSAIAMSEDAFNRQPLEFVEKVFFVNE